MADEQIKFSAPAGLRKKVKQAAKADRRTMAQWIILVIEERLGGERRRAA